MSTRLTQAAASAKQLGLAVAIIIPILVIARFGWTYVSQATAPVPTPPPPYTNPIYNQLPTLNLPSDTVRSNQVRISLNTADLRIPQVSYSEPTVTVPAYKVRNTNFNFLQNISRIADIFEIEAGDPVELQPTIFRFSDNTPDGSRLDINIQYFHSKFYYANPSAFVPIERGGTIPETAALSAAQSLRNSLGTFLEISPPQSAPPGSAPIKTHETNYAYRDLSGEITKVTNQNSANLTEIKLMREPYNQIPFVGPSTTQSNIRMTYTQQRAAVTSAVSNRPRLISADIVYWPLATVTPGSTELAVYPTRPITQAYQDLLDGKGYILSPTDNDTTYLILRAYLAYFEPATFAPYAIPVWVFEGDTVTDPEFLFRAIVPAIATGWIAE